MLYILVSYAGENINFILLLKTFNFSPFFFKRVTIINKSPKRWLNNVTKCWKIVALNDELPTNRQRCVLNDILNIFFPRVASYSSTITALLRSFFFFPFFASLLTRFPHWKAVIKTFFSRLEYPGPVNIGLIYDITLRVKSFPTLPINRLHAFAHSPYL